MFTRRELKRALGPLGDHEEMALKSAWHDMQEFGPDELVKLVDRLRAQVDEQKDTLSAGAAFGIGKVAKRLQDLSQSSLLLMEAACRETSS